MCVSNYLVVLNEQYLRDDLSTVAFKYGGKIKVVGYITNKVVAQNNTKVSVTEVNRVLSSEFSLSWLHKYYTPEIIDGRAYDENESGVALIPAVFEEYDHTQGITVERKGSDFLGKILEVEDFSGAIREFQIVGTYNTTDPIFTGKELLIPRAELMEISSELTQLENSPFSSDEYYVVVADTPKIHRSFMLSLKRRLHVTHQDWMLILIHLTLLLWLYRERLFSL